MVQFDFRALLTDNSFCSDREHLAETLFHFLFDFPTAERHGIVQPPICKTEHSRALAYNLIKSIIHNEQDLHQLAFNLLDKYELVQTSESTLPWNYDPLSHQRSPTGYVGLKNLGCTCYMNSLIQQLVANLKFDSNPFSDRKSISYFVSVFFV